MKKVVMITEFTNGTSQVLVEPLKMAFERVTAIRHNPAGVRKVQVIGGFADVYEEKFEKN